MCPRKEPPKRPGPGCQAATLHAMPLYSSTGHLGESSSGGLGGAGSSLAEVAASGQRHAGRVEGTPGTGALSIFSTDQGMCQALSSSGCVPEPSGPKDVLFAVCMSSAGYTDVSQHPAICCVCFTELQDPWGTTAKRPRPCEAPLWAYCILTLLPFPPSPTLVFQRPGRPGQERVLPGHVPAAQGRAPGWPHRLYAVDPVQQTAHPWPDVHLRELHLLRQQRGGRVPPHHTPPGGEPLAPMPAPWHPVAGLWRAQSESAASLSSSMWPGSLRDPHTCWAAGRGLASRSAHWDMR